MCFPNILNRSTIFVKTDFRRPIMVSAILISCLYTKHSSAIKEKAILMFYLHITHFNDDDKNKYCLIF